LVFKFLNSYLTQDAIYNLGEQIKFFEIIQKSLEKCFNLVLSNSLIALKISVAAMSPHLFVSLVAKFLHEKMEELGLTLFLNETNLFTMGFK
jgi:hypothetical protein